MEDPRNLHELVTNEARESLRAYMHRSVDKMFLAEDMQRLAELSLELQHGAAMLVSFNIILMPEGPFSEDDEVFVGTKYLDMLPKIFAETCDDVAKEWMVTDAPRQAGPGD
jgi:hypothetical protein